MYIYGNNNNKITIIQIYVEKIFGNEVGSNKKLQQGKQIMFSHNQ